MLPDKIAFVDLETTGSRASYDRIIEVGILRVENNKIVETFNTLVNPQKHLPPEIVSLTGITSDDLINAPTFHQVAKNIRTMIKDCVFVAHNVRFDYSFLKHELKREEITYTSKHFCTVKLSRMLYPAASHHNLDAIIERCGFTCEKRHRAFDDAKILYDFYLKIQKDFPTGIVESAINNALKKPSLPTKLTENDLYALPESPGVYLFYGPEPRITEDGLVVTETTLEKETKPLIPLYIGKSKNIKERVLSHFAGDLASSREMRINQQIETIETIPTAGELGALLLESALIKQHLPIYNRMLRVKHELIAVKKNTDVNGYSSVYLEPIQEIHPEDLPTIVGFFRSRKQAKEFLATLAKEHLLCEKLLGLEKTTSSCFGYRLNRCNGACIGKENTLFYNLRFVSAFSKSKITPWPFDGPIVIEERSELDERVDFFIIDQWCFIGSRKYTMQDTLFDHEESQRIFDLDVYKIIRRFLNSPLNMKKVRDLKNFDTYNTSQEVLA